MPIKVNKVEYNLPVYYYAHTIGERRKIREQYVREQKGRCFYCGELLTDSPSNKVMANKINRSLFPPKFFNYPVHLQHCHKTGWTEGAVHARCNAFMWQYEGR